MFSYFSEREDATQEVASVESSSPPVTWKEVREGLAPAVRGYRRVWLVRSNWGSTPRTRKLLKRVLVKLRGGVVYSEGYLVDDAYNERLATFPDQANLRLFLFARTRGHTPNASRNTRP
jgi:hypothetical protein